MASSICSPHLCSARNVATAVHVSDSSKHQPSTLRLLSSRTSSLYSKANGTAVCLSLAADCRKISGRKPISPKAVLADVETEEKERADSHAAVLPFRVGHGFDLHRLEPGLPLIIGGVNIPHDRGCEAHSDGDVLMHCIVDAILGALSLPDIGQLFPDNDAKWKGAPSHVFMTEAVKRMQERGYRIGNLDATIILQRPKLSPHKQAIIANICELLQASPEVVNVKAKTHEKVDSLGENRSVACHTVVLLIRD